MNICERLVVMTESQRIGIDNLPTSITSHLPLRIVCDIDMMEDGRTLPQIMAAVERGILMQALEKHGTRARAAEALGINQSTIARKLKKSDSNAEWR